MNLHGVKRFMTVTNHQPSLQNQIALAIATYCSTGSVPQGYFKMGKCEGDVSAAFNSLKRDVRRAFLDQYPNPVVPSYSLPAVSDESSTSKGLLESWKMMTAFALRQDSQLAFDDAIIPGSKLLGGAKADHLAVALPFDKSTDATVRSMADKGHYPRAALLESIVRFVSADLEGK